MIWIVIPAFNESASLSKLLPKIQRFMQRRDHAYRIVVVNDGSTDDSSAVLQDFARQMPVDIVTHPINRGLGETERDGFEYVALRCHHDDTIVRIEGDGTHGPEYIPTLLSRLEEGYDVVNTSRFQPGGDQIGVSSYRAFISRTANLFMHFVFRIPGTRDYSCGLRIYRAKIIQDAVRLYGNSFIQLKGLGFTSTLEMIVKLHLMGCRFSEVPFVLRYDLKIGSSKMVSSITTLGYLIMALLYHWPFGGWKSQYRGLDQAYAASPEKALARYGRTAIEPKTVSRISL